MKHAARLETGCLKSGGQGSLELPLHVPSHAYLGLSFHFLIKPFPFLADSVVQNPGWDGGTTPGGSVHRRTTRGVLIKGDFKGLKVQFFLLVTLCLYHSILYHSDSSFLALGAPVSCCLYMFVCTFSSCWAQPECFHTSHTQDLIYLQYLKQTDYKLIKCVAS